MTIISFIKGGIIVDMKIDNKTLHWHVPGWGHFGITADSSGLIRLQLNSRKDFQQCLPFVTPNDTPDSVIRDDSTHGLAIQQIKEYLWGKRREFNLPFVISVSDTHQILTIVSSIKYGETGTYADIANKLGTSWDLKPVIAILTINPLPLIIPCHRVIKNDHDIGDYIWGKRIKERLLRLEAINKNKRVDRN